MYKDKKILAFVPARAGSKRIKNKNKKLLKGKPLFTYSVLVAKESKYIDDVIVSSDSQESGISESILGTWYMLESDSYGWVIYVTMSSIKEYELYKE